MEINIESLIPFDSLQDNIEHIFSIVEKNGKAILLKDNKPAYIILKYDKFFTNELPIETEYYTLQDAMKLVLSEAEGHKMHASKLAEEIYNRRLYLKKNGSKAEYNQIRARCEHYKDMFETLPSNYIKLKT